MALLSGPAGSSPPGSAPGRHSARMPEWSHVARRGTNARMAETAHKCNTATLDAVEASIEPWRTAALSEHGDGAKPTPMTGRGCTQVQPSVKASVKAKAQRQGPALRLSVAPWCRLRGSVASSEHGDGAKPTPMIGREVASREHGDGAEMTGRYCTQMQPSVKASVRAKAQRQGPALRLSVAPWCRLRGSCQNKNVPRC